MLRNGSVPTRGGARAGRTSGRRKHAGREYTHERLVRARNSLNKLISQGLLFTYLDPLGTPDARDDQPDRKHERPITPDAARPPRNVPDPTHESRVLVVLHPLSSPATSSDDPGDHAHRRSPRKCLVPRQPNTPSHRHHPRLGRRNLLQRTPPHHPLPQHLGLTPQPTRFVLQPPCCWGLDPIFQGCYCISCWTNEC